MVLQRCGTLFLLMLGMALIVGVCGAPLRAQTTTATILGDVKDPSGAAVPSAKVTVSNTGTGAIQNTTSDAEGRFRVPALPIGTYDVSVENAGFQTQIHKGVVLTIGAEVVVDFALSVGQVAQTVTVEAAVAQVETTSSAVGNLVEPTQMRELPLNGRSFEQLILLSPGVTIHQAIGYQPVNGTGNAYSVSGSRTRGQWEILDGNDVMNFVGRGSGSGVLGTQLGVDAIAEFQVLTNTYSAQFGGNGAVVNMVTRSGTNALHGSGYEFARDQVFDARRYFDSVTAPFRKNQFGGTLGGPIKKDKMFFFFNYEGIRQNQSPLYNYLLPDEQAHYGFTPDANGNYQCANNAAIAYSAASFKNTGAGSCYVTIPASVQNLLKNMPLPNDPGTPIANYTQRANANGVIDGTISANEQTQQPGSEDYLVGRYDWNVNEKNSIFGRYLRDSGNQLFPFAGATLASSGIPGATVQGASSQGRSLNQYVALGEKYIASGNLVLSTSLGYTRSLNFAYHPASYTDYQFGQPNLFTNSGISSTLFPSGPLGTISISPLVSPNITFPQLGGGSNFRQLQNKYSIGEDVYWTHGAHGFTFGGSVQKVQTYGLTPPTPGAWTFANVKSFLQLTPNANATVICDPNAFAACSNIPTVTPVTWFRETNFGIYGQDSWRVRKNLTLNIGLRYSPQTNPIGVGQLREWVNLPLSASYDPTKPMPGCASPGTSGCSGSLAPGTLPTTVVSHVFLKNISLHNFEPRIGLAWDPFGDQKTSVRAGFGMFRSPILPYDYTAAGTASGYVASPYVNVNFTCPAGCPSFPGPLTSALAVPLLGGGGIDPGSKATPYMEQWNLSIQRQIDKNNIVSVAYVGSRGVNLIGGYDQNPEVAVGSPGGIVVCPTAATTTTCNVPNGSYLLLPPGLASQVPGACVTIADPGCTVRTTPGPVTTASGKAALDTQTGQQSYQIFTATAAGVVSIRDNIRQDPTLTFSTMRAPLFWSMYNSIQASWQRRMSNNLQYQISYTYATCLSNSSGTSGFENGMNTMNPYNFNQDKGNCGYLIHHDLSVNGMYMLPFNQNQLVRGWQVSAVGTYHTGSPIDISNGWASGIIGARGGPIPPRPNLVPNCNQQLQTINQWFNVNCYTMAPVGEPGNLPFFSVLGPDYHQWDLSLTKNTKFKERYAVQFRLEVFNAFNRTNFRNPGQPMSFLYTQNTPVTASCVTTPSACSSPLSTAGQLFDINGTPRQMQLGVKFSF